MGYVIQTIQWRGPARFCSSRLCDAELPLIGKASVEVALSVIFSNGEVAFEQLMIGSVCRTIFTLPSKPVLYA